MLWLLRISFSNLLSLYILKPSTFVTPIIRIGWFSTFLYLIVADIRSNAFPSRSQEFYRHQEYITVFLGAI